jgi:hypothetical protein
VTGPTTQAHEGPPPGVGGPSCRACGRELANPLSIRRGMGPVCRRRAFYAAHPLQLALAIPPWWEPELPGIAGLEQVAT